MSIESLEMKKVLVTGTSVDERFLQPLLDAGLEVKNPKHLLSDDELANELKTSVAYLLGGDEYASANALATAEHLRVIAFLGVGYESFIDVKAATGLGVSVTNTPGTLTESVAQFTIGQLLNAQRRLTFFGDTFVNGDTGSEYKTHDLGHVGIVGLGAIGTRIAEILRQGFDVPVSYFSRTRKPDLESRLGLNFEPTLESLVAAVDSIVLMLPGNEETYNIVNSDVLSAIKDGAVLINTARAELIDPDALLKSAPSGSPSVTVFDGFYNLDEVPAARKLLDLGRERLLVTGHIASLTNEARDGMAIKAVQSIMNVLGSGTDQYIVNPSA